VKPTLARPPPLRTAFFRPTFQARLESTRSVGCGRDQLSSTVLRYVSNRCIAASHDTHEMQSSVDALVSTWHQTSPCRFARCNKVRMLRARKYLPRDPNTRVSHQK